MNLAVLAGIGKEQEKIFRTSCSRRTKRRYYRSTTGDGYIDRVRRSVLIHLSTCVLVIPTVLSVGMHRVEVPRSHGRWPLGRLITQNLLG